MTQNAISAALAALRERGRFVLTAPTGWGKSTRIPLALLDAAPEGKVLVLEPRRVAARSLARYVAGLHRQKVGGEVGYWVRFDNRTHEGTRLTYMTEGIFLQLLRQNPTLDGISAVIFDEFHERSIFSDAALALVKGLVAAERPDLWVGVMSATLDADRIGAYLDAPVIHAGSPVVETTEEGADVISNGRFRVEVRYRPNAPLARIFAEIAELGEGAVLIFEPGKAEITATIEEVRRTLPNAWALPLHSELPDEEQDLIFQPAPEGTRKVVVATNIAETSITIPDVQFVVDRGWEKVFEYDHQRGFGALRLKRISRASAAQRGGRAGRLRDGAVFRLWSREEHLRLPEAREPEIRRVDLAGLVLLLKSFGVRDVAHLEWLDHPGVAALEAAERTLYTLGALDREGDITEVGRAMQRLPLEPHIARMVVEAQRVGGLDTVVKIAALTSVPRVLLRPRDKEYEATQAQEAFLAAAREGKSDLFALVAAYDAARQHHFDMKWCRDHFVRCKALREAHEIMRQLREILRRHGITVRREDNDTGAARRAIAAGFADALWQYEGWGDYRQNGHRAKRARESVVEAQWVVAAEQRQVPTRRGGTLNLILGLTEVDPAWLVEIAPADQVREQYENVRFDPDLRRVVADRVILLRGQEVVRERVPWEREGATRAFAGALVDWWGHLHLNDPLRGVARENEERRSAVERLQRRGHLEDALLTKERLQAWYEERLSGATSLEEVDADRIRLTDDEVGRIIGMSISALKAHVEKHYPDEVAVRGYTVRFTYSFDGENVTVDAPVELIPSLVERDLPALPGCTLYFKAGDIRGASPDELRVNAARAACRERTSFRVGEPVHVEHPDGRQEIAGYIGRRGSTPEAFSTAEKARQETTTWLLFRMQGRADDVFRQVGLDYSDRRRLGEALTPHLKERATAVEYISSETLEEILSWAEEKARKAADEIVTMREAAQKAVREARHLAMSQLASPEEKERLESVIPPLESALNYGVLEGLRDALEAVLKALDEFRPLIEERERWMRELQGRLGQLEEQDVGPFRHLLSSLISEAREALNPWGHKPDLGRAEAVISRAEAAVEVLSPHLDDIREEVEAHLARCPLCGDSMGSLGCSWGHGEEKMAAVLFPEGENEAVLLRLVTDTGEVLVEIIADRGGGVRRVFHLPTHSFRSVRVERVHLLDEEARKLMGRIRDLEWELEDLRERLEAWEATDDGEDLAYIVFPDVTFIRGEHRGRPQWQARVRHGGRDVKLVVGHWCREPEPGRTYAARVAKVIVDKPRFAVALVEIHDVAALRAEIEEKETQLAALRRSLARLRGEETGDEDGEEGGPITNLAQALAAAWGARVKA